MKVFLTLDDIGVKNKTVLLRTDINSPIDENGNVIDNERIEESVKTVRELIEKKAKVVILTHQGRRGNPDFINLEQHAELLSKHLGKEVKFVDDIIGEKAISAIKSLKEGEALLLDNVRFLEDETQKKSPEEHSKSKIVQALAPLANFFVNDAFSVCHRSHASVVGFTYLLPSAAGRNLEKEIESLQNILYTMKISRYDTFVLGGAKPEDPLKIMKHMFETNVLEKVLTCGVLGEIFLIAKGYDLGKPTHEFLQKKGYLEFLEKAKELLDKYGERIELPMDVAFELEGKRVEIGIEELPINYNIMDIGSRTCSIYEKIIEGSVVIGMKGPAGIYERKGFEKGTEKLLNAIADSKAISLIGGGNTLDALRVLKIDKSKFTHISLGGGALITFISGEKMPGIEALKEAYRRWKNA